MLSAGERWKWNGVNEMNKVEHDNYRIVIELYNGSNFMSDIHSHSDAERISKKLKEQIKRHIDLPYGTNIYFRYDTFEYCEWCGLDVTDKTDVCSKVEWHDGELSTWPGMPTCCIQAQVLWAKENPPPPPLMMPNWVIDELKALEDES
jgi:hypothetical protein